MKKLITVAVSLILLITMVAPLALATDAAPFTPVESTAFRGLCFIRMSLKNPSSLIVNEILTFPSLSHPDGIFFIWIDFSAQNGFGGYTRSNYVYYENTVDGQVYFLDWATNERTHDHVKFDNLRLTDMGKDCTAMSSEQIEKLVDAMN